MPTFMRKPIDAFVSVAGDTRVAPTGIAVRRLV